MSVFFPAVIALGTFVLWRSWKAQKEWHLSLMLSGWMAIAFGVIGWTFDFKDVGTAFAIVTVSLTALSVIAFIAYRTWDGNKDGKPSKPRRQRPQAEEDTGTAAIGAVKTIAATLLAGPIAGILAIALCIGAGRFVHANGWSEADKLGLIYIGVPALWAIISAYVLMARSWVRRIVVTVGLIAFGAISLVATA
ncbi:MAG: hypothetical protein AAF950_13860 [Pseudomonadota bacterium]